MQALFQAKPLTGQVRLHKIEVLLRRFLQLILEPPFWIDTGHGVDESSDGAGHGVGGKRVGSFTLRRHGQDKSS